MLGLSRAHETDERRLGQVGRILLATASAFSVTSTASPPRAAREPIHACSSSSVRGRRPVDALGEPALEARRRPRHRRAGGVVLPGRRGRASDCAPTSTQPGAGGLAERILERAQIRMTLQPDARLRSKRSSIALGVIAEHRDSAAASRWRERSQLDPLQPVEGVVARRSGRLQVARDRWPPSSWPAPR